MYFKDFKEWAAENIKDFLPEKYSDASISLETVTKTGVNYDAMIVHPEGNYAVPAINLDDMYEEYINGKSLHDIGKEMATIIQMESPKFDTSMLNSYESLKDHLFIRVCNATENEDLLSKVPHSKVEDLAVTYHIMVNANDDGIASAMITNDILKNIGITAQQLHEDALRNSQEILPARMDSMMNMLMGMTGIAPEIPETGRQPVPMLVVTNERRLNGAAAFFYPDIKERIADKIGDFWMLPSSIHEIIAIPVKGSPDLSYLQEMVKTINRTQVEKEERLSDHIYRYDAERKEFGVVLA